MNLITAIGLLFLVEAVTEPEFETLHRSLQPTGEEVWRSIPWETSVLSAQQRAAAEQKPIFIWAMDGHPLGCT